MAVEQKRCIYAMQREIEPRKRVNKFRQVRCLVCKPRRRLFHYRQRRARHCQRGLSEDDRFDVGSSRRTAATAFKAIDKTCTFRRRAYTTAAMSPHPAATGRGRVGVVDAQQAYLSLQGCCMLLQGQPAS